MPKIVDYTVIEESDPGIFRESVLRALSHGWQPIGGVAVHDNILATREEAPQVYYQAMVRYEEGGEDA